MPEHRGKTVIDSKRCKGCGLCVAVCPQKSLQQTNIADERGIRPVLFSEEGSCTACTLCAVVCPDLAVTVYIA